MAKVFKLHWQLLWLSCCVITLANAFSHTDADRRHHRKRNNAGRDHRTRNTVHFPNQRTSDYKHELRREHQRLHGQTTSLPEFLPDGHRQELPDPSFMPEETYVEAYRGDEAVLPCTIQYLGSKQVSWKKEDSDHFLAFGTTVWYHAANLRVDHRVWPAEVSDWNLVFRSARVDDSGVYLCEIVANQKLTWKVKLAVFEKPPHNPDIKIEGKKFVESGARVFLQCNTTEGDSIPDDIDWFKDGDKIEPSRFPNTFVSKFRSKETMSLISQLHIPQGETQDSGTYICRSLPSLTATSIEVNVLKGKKADSANVKRGTGSSSTRVQPVSGNPNVGSSTMRRYILGHPLVFLAVFLVHFLVDGN